MIDLITKRQLGEDIQIFETAFKGLERPRGAGDLSCLSVSLRQTRELAISARRNNDIHRTAPVGIAPPSSPSFCYRSLPRKVPSSLSFS